MSGALLRKCFDHILREVHENPGMSEDELYSVLDRSEFFDYLGYSRFGVDVRKQFVIIGERKKADYVCLDEYQNVIFVIEAKKPREKLEDALEQLWERYVLPLKARYGVLTNGWRFIVYKRLLGDGYEPVIDVELEKVSESQCDRIFGLLRKPEYEISLLPRVKEYFASVETLSLKEPLAKEYFFETFKLNLDSVFGVLIRDLVELFDWIYPRSKFLKGAYGFWRRSLAREPEKIPDSWKPFLRNEKDVFKFMYCLETAHALLARMILAKACEDLDFPGINISRFTLEKIHQVRDQIPVLGYPLMLIRLLKEMRDQLIYSIFEDDIFSWWVDAFVGFSGRSSVELLQERVNDVLESFSRAIAKVILVLYKFDFSEVAGDPLGDLYQQYFDRETRRALGEFYTPEDVVRYILDNVNYRNVRHRRLLDPACGSGTFLVEALRRYLKEAKPIAEEYGWTYVLRELCNSPKIVGLDIHPFACLIAQVRFMLELIPYYKKALDEERLAVYESLQRLPVFRTDSLVKEMMPQEFRKVPTLMVTKEDIRFRIALPVRTDGEKSFSISVVIPSWRKTASGTEHNLFNLDEYFCVIQGIFDAVKSIIEAEGSEVPLKGLEAHIKKYLTNKDFPLIAGFFKPYADKILLEIRRSQIEFQDGRLMKSIEDAILSSLLKNYMQYDFVVGNPPYVKTQMFKKNKAYIRKMYKTAYRNFDIFVPFVERAIDWLREGGKFGFIISNMFHNRDYGEKLRAYILKTCMIKEFINFGASGVFEEVTNYPCILILARERMNNNMIRCVRVAKAKENMLDEIKRFSAEKRVSNEFMDIFEYEQDSLTSAPWTLMPEEENAVFSKIKSGDSRRLKEVSDPILGIKEATRTGANEVFIIDEKKADAFQIEKELLIPKIKGAKEIKRWHISWDGRYIIFPYTVHEGLFIPIDINEFPNTKRYLASYRKRLEKRKLFNKTIIEHGKNWFELWNPLPFIRPKIVYPEISKNNSFALDEKNYYCVGKNFIIYLNSGRREDFLFLLGLLNSNVLEFYFKHIASIKRGNYFEYMGNVGEMPLVDNVDRKTKAAIAQKVDTILQSKDPERFLEHFPAYLERYQNKTIEFDEITYTFLLKHAKLEPVLSGQSDGGYVIYPGENEGPIWVDTREKAQFLGVALRNREVRKGSKLQILIPKDNRIVIEMLEDFKETLEKTMSVSVPLLEEEVSEVVYQLYDLNEHDKAVIEDFLKKF